MPLEDDTNADEANVAADGANFVPSVMETLGLDVLNSETVVAPSLLLSYAVVGDAVVDCGTPIDTVDVFSDECV